MARDGLFADYQRIVLAVVDRVGLRDVDVLRRELLAVSPVLEVARDSQEWLLWLDAVKSATQNVNGASKAREKAQAERDRLVEDGQLELF